MDDSTADALANNLKQLPQALAVQAPNTPEGLSVPLLFQYSDGVRFVAEAYRRGGWPAVDALYRKPPESTHQILHPALYFDRKRADAAHRARGLRTNHERMEKSRRRHLRRIAAARYPRAQSRQAIHRTRTRRAMGRRPHGHPAAEPRRERDLDARRSRTRKPPATSPSCTRLCSIACLATRPRIASTRDRTQCWL